MCLPPIIIQLVMLINYTNREVSVDLASGNLANGNQASGNLVNGNLANENLANGNQARNTKKLYNLEIIYFY